MKLSDEQNERLNIALKMFYHYHQEEGHDILSDDDLKVTKGEIASLFPIIEAELVKSKADKVFNCPYRDGYPCHEAEEIHDTHNDYAKDLKAQFAEDLEWVLKKMPPHTLRDKNYYAGILNLIKKYKGEK